MLNSIVIVTISVLNLGAIESAYQQAFAYETVEKGVLSAELTKLWGASGMTGRDYLLMRPPGEAGPLLRFIENPESKGYQPMTDHGWNAIELLAENPDALAAQLADSPFKIIGEPKDLWPGENVPRVMQALGPGNEVLYLTNNKRFSFDQFVDRVFIMVLAGSSMSELRQYYAETFDITVDEPAPYPIGVVNRAQGRSADTTYPLAIARLSDEYLIELDEYPADTGPRSVADNMLPPGVAMVSVVVPDLDALNLEWRGAPIVATGPGYEGRRTAVTVGPAGEWLELIEAK